MNEARVRRMRTEDAEAAAGVVAATHDEDRPERSPEELRRFHDGLARFPSTDPDGSWVAEVDGALVGLGLAVRRAHFWGLSMLFVHPDHQGHGLGRRLMERTLATAEGATEAMIMSSDDPRALRRYALAGFDLHPAVEATGPVDRAALPADLPGRAGDASDLDLVEAVDLRLHGRSRAADAAFVLAQGAALDVVDGPHARGFVVHRDGEPRMLGADDQQVATALLWRVLAAAEGEVKAWAWTAAQGWAVRVAVAARLTLKPGGAMFLRGRAAVPGPWLPSGWFF